MVVQLDSYHVIPAFASSENVQLGREIHDLEIQIKAARLAAEEDREQSLQLRRHLGRSQKSITSLQQMVCDAAQQLQGESTLLQIARFALKRTQTETLRLHRVADTAKELEEAVRNRQVAAGLQLQHAQARTHQAQATLEEWTENLTYQETTLASVQNLTQAEEAEERRLMQHIQKAAETVKSLEQEVLSESAEAEAVLLELERVAGAYRQAHQEHQDLLRAVEVARAGLKEADASLEARHAEVARSRKDEQGGRAAAAAAQARLDGLRQEAAAREHQIAAAEAQRAQRAQELHAAQQAEQDAQQRVEDLRLQLSRARQEVAGREESLASARASLEALQHVAQASQAAERTDAACLVGKGGEEEQGTGALLDLETARDAAAFELAGLERERTKARDRAAAAVAALKEAERNLGALAVQVQQAAGALAATQGQNSALEKEVFMEQDVLYGCEMQRHRLEQEVGQLTRGIKTEEEDLVKAVAAARQDLAGAKAEEARVRTSARESKLRLEQAVAKKNHVEACLVEEMAALRLQITAVQTLERMVHSANRDRVAALVKLDMWRMEVRSLDVTVDREKSDLTQHQAALQAQSQAFLQEQSQLADRLAELKALLAKEQAAAGLALRDLRVQQAATVAIRAKLEVLAFKAGCARGAEREATAAAEEHEAQEAVTALQMELVKTQDLSAGLEKALSEAQEANALSAKQGRLASNQQMAEQIVEDKAALLKLLDEVKELRRENAAAEQAAEAAEAACMEAEVEVEAARAELERLRAAQVTARSSLVDQLAKAARAHGALARSHAPTAARCAQLPAAAWCRAAGADLRLPARIESLRPLAQWLDVAGAPVQLAMLSMLQRAAVDALLAADEACPGAGVAQALREAAPWAIRGSAAQRSGRLRRRSSASQGMDSARSCCSASGQILLRVQSVALGVPGLEGRGEGS
ncbi:hypothetical protein ACKKBG_A15810 [Auxenochlorella protothecoides x Auxenochlorella symbiontica]